MPFLAQCYVLMSLCIAAAIRDDRIQSNNRESSQTDILFIVIVSISLLGIMLMCLCFFVRIRLNKRRQRLKAQKQFFNVMQHVADGGSDYINENVLLVGDEDCLIPTKIDCLQERIPAQFAIDSTHQSNLMINGIQEIPTISASKPSRQYNASTIIGVDDEKSLPPLPVITSDFEEDIEECSAGPEFSSNDTHPNMIDASSILSHHEFNKEFENIDDDNA